MLRDAFKSLVNPVVEKAMHSLSLEDKIMYLECGSQQVQEYLENCDARIEEVVADIKKETANYK